VTKHGVNPEDYAAVYPTSGKVKFKPGEKESMRKEPFQIKIEESDEKIDAMSRLNFSRVYTVEHNVKVKNIGRIPPDEVPRLIHYFRDSIAGPDLTQLLRPSSPPYILDPPVGHSAYVVPAVVSTGYGSPPSNPGQPYQAYQYQPQYQASQSPIGDVHTFPGPAYPATVQMPSQGSGGYSTSYNQYPPPPPRDAYVASYPGYNDNAQYDERGEVPGISPRETDEREELSSARRRDNQSRAGKGKSTGKDRDRDGRRARHR